MTTSVMQDILTDILDEEPIPPEKIAYLQTRAKLRLHDLILKRFALEEDKQNLEQVTIARRLGQSRARISQQLAVPGNWTIDSVTKLAAAIGGEIDFSWRDFPKSPSGQIGEMMALSRENRQPPPHIPRNESNETPKSSASSISQSR